MDLRVSLVSAGLGGERGAAGAASAAESPEGKSAPATVAPSAPLPRARLPWMTPRTMSWILAPANAAERSAMLAIARRDRRSSQRVPRYVFKLFKPLMTT